jgi:hypothetical protein
MQTPPSLPLKKPKTFMLAGVGLLIVGIFYFLGLAMSIATAAIPALRAQDPALKLLDTDPSYAPVHYTNMFLSGGLGLVAICAGIGLIRSKNWGRQSGIAWAALSILNVPFNLWVANKYMMPVMQAEMQKHASGNASSAQAGEIALVIGKVATIGSLVGLVALCIVLIIFLARPKMKAWCRMQETRPQEVG